MKNTDIKYRTSRDYCQLHKLLKEGIIIIGFVAISIDNVPNMDNSKLTTMSYNSKFKSFDIGVTLFEQDFDRVGFYKICQIHNIQYVIQ